MEYLLKNYMEKLEEEEKEENAMIMCQPNGTGFNFYKRHDEIYCSVH
jgi:selenophosphate synthase